MKEVRGDPWCSIQGVSFIQIAGNFGRGVGGLGGDSHTWCRGFWEGGARSGKSREMENISRGTTFEDFVIIRIESSM
jgi:hypothetical protein